MSLYRPDKCNCGHPICQDYFVLGLKSEGRMTQDQAILVSMVLNAQRENQPITINGRLIDASVIDPQRRN